LSSETGAHQELPLDILASEALWPSEEAEALNDESGNLFLSCNSGLKYRVKYHQSPPKVWK
jgi:hypothetical protein